eukprot:296570-Alexandrium_andersonii.AAC.1
MAVAHSTLQAQFNTQGTRRSGYASARSAHPEQTQLNPQTQLATRSELNSQISNSRGQTLQGTRTSRTPARSELGPANSTPS